jgi:hypothetical protein
VRRTFKPVWTEARVKTPWVEALAQKRAEEDAAARTSTGAATNAPKPTSPTPELDLTPRKMKDSYYRTVGMDDRAYFILTPGLIPSDRHFRSRRIPGSLTHISMLLDMSGMRLVQNMTR